MSEGDNREESRATAPPDLSGHEAQVAEGKTVADLLAQVQSDPNGLTPEEASRRLEKFGFNELPEKKVNPLFKLLSYFWGPIPVMIEIAAALSAVLKHWADLGVILALLILNALVGFREEYQAGNAVAALKEQLALKASVKRAGKWEAIPSREVVPGDVVRLRMGAIVPADAHLLGGDPILVDQSALTGESLPVERKMGDEVYSGSIVKQGETDAVVHATGVSAYSGRTAQLVQEAGQSRSHFQKAVIRIANYLILVALTLAVAILVVSLFRHDKVLEVLQFALVLTIAAVPVAMPAVLSVTMALGARMLAAKQAIVTKLSAVEELAGMDILCSDKTGTLTQNHITAGDPFLLASDGAGTATVDATRVMIDAALASQESNQDPIDLAVLGSIKDRSVLETYKVARFIPFDPVRKYTEAEVERQTGLSFKTAKGAPQVILALDPEADSIRPQVEEAVNNFAARGYRSLGVAATDGTGAYHFEGVIPLFDPLREDTAATIQAAMGMGVKIKMITGDQVAIAKEIARQLDLGQEILSADALGDEKYSQPEALAAAVAEADGFAQVFPEHKYRIVKSLQFTKHIVGMTGDGVNDAPALKQADVGIAVAGATDAARAAADIVLMRPGLSVIVDAIRESRKTFQRMTNYAIYRIAETVALLAFLALAITLANFYPVTATMIVLLAILNDGAILSIAYDRVKASSRPDAWDMRQVLGVAVFLGFFAAVRSFGIFYLADHVFGLGHLLVLTMVYLNLSIGGHLTLFAARTRRSFWTVRPANILLLAVLGTQVVATLIAVYGFLMTPIGWTWAGVVWGYCLVMFALQDQLKRVGVRIVFGRRSHVEDRSRPSPTAGHTEVHIAEESHS